LARFHSDLQRFDSTLGKKILIGCNFTGGLIGINRQVLHPSDMASPSCGCESRVILPAMQPPANQPKPDLRAIFTCAPLQNKGYFLQNPLATGHTGTGNKKGLSAFLR
jgi:hypothetical protein